MSDCGADDIDLPIEDMLEIYMSGGNGSEYVDGVGLLKKAADELRELRAALIAAERRGRIAGLREAAEIVREWPYVQYIEGMHLEARIRARASKLEASE